MLTVYELSEKIMQFLQSADMSAGISAQEISEQTGADIKQVRAVCDALEAVGQIHISKSFGLNGKELHYIIDKVLT